MNLQKSYIPWYKHQCIKKWYVLVFIQRNIIDVYTKEYN